MDPKQRESNWAHACRVFGLDWPGVLLMNADHSTLNASGLEKSDVSPDSHGAPDVVAYQSRQRSADDP